MNTKSYSIKLPARTVIGCCQILERSKRPCKGFPVESVISSALNSIIDTLEISGSITIPDEELSEGKLKEMSGIPDEPKVTIDNSVKQVITEMALAIQELDDEVFVKRITKNDITRISPDDTPIQEKEWKLVPVVEVENDQIYTASDNELFKMAVRATYFNLDRKRWGTPETAKLCISTYNIIKKSEDQSTKTQNNG